MKLSTLVAPLLKWWWLLLIATALAGGTSYYITRPMPPIYLARTTLMVGRGLNEPNPSGNELVLSRQLAEAYAGFVQREPVYKATAVSLGLEQLPSYGAAAVPNSPFIEISVTDIDPQRAQIVANELARQLILQSPTSSEQTDPARAEFIEQQLNDLELEIAKTAEDIQKKQDELPNLTSAVQLADAQADLDALQTKLNLLQNNYISLFTSTRQGAINYLEVIEPAFLPSEPIGPNKKLIIALSAAAGLLLAAGAAHLLEFLDKTLHTPEDIQRVLQTTVLGYIGDMSDAKSGWDYVNDNPRSPIAEAFRALRTNLEFASIDKPVKTILITSPAGGDGKTTISTNLALSIAQAEKRVVLLDGDLRRPNIHTVTGISNQPGMTDVFRDRLNVFDVARSWKDKRVIVVTAGSTPPNAAELLGSKRMDQTLATLRDVVDFVIIDGPPVIVTDATVLASKVDGVLIVIRPGQTREEVAQAMIEQFRRVGANVIGVVLNRIPRGSAAAYGGHPFYSPSYGKSYYGSGDDKKPAKAGKELTPEPRQAQETSGPGI